MASRALRIVNESSHHSARVEAAVDAMRKAVQIQLREVARVWGEYVYSVVDDARQRGFKVVLLDDSDAADAAGYHDLDRHGAPYARVFVSPILDNGGTWLRGSNSVSATLSHEACELVGDPTANHWVENARGALVAVELCDPVESCRVLGPPRRRPARQRFRFRVSRLVQPLCPRGNPGRPHERIAQTVRDRSRRLRDSSHRRRRARHLGSGVPALAQSREAQTGLPDGSEASTRLITATFGLRPPRTGDAPRSRWPGNLEAREGGEMRKPKLLKRTSTLTVACATAVSFLSLSAFSAPPATAAANPFPRSVVGGFASKSGNGFWLVYANGAVDHFGDGAFFGDAQSLSLKGPLQGGARVASGAGYWLVSSDGGIFSYGSAHFFGSMGAVPLSQPVFSMASTNTGNGYWLVAHDGGVFTFGDAKFYGSTGGIKLSQPIVGLIAHGTGKGYTMIAGDGGVFDFGDKGFFGSLPGRGINVSDAVGLARTPSGRGYWIVRSGGQVYPFGNARGFKAYTASPCDPVVAIISNPAAVFQGYRLVLRSGATVSFGQGLDGRRVDRYPGRVLVATTR